MGENTYTKRAPNLRSIQSLRGIAALLVVFSHLWVIEAKYSPDQITSSILCHGIAGVDLFFVISGFIMVYITQNAPRGLSGIGQFSLARGLRIYPLYWAVSLAILCVYLWRPDIVFAGFSDGMGQPKLWKSFLLWPDIIPSGIRPPLLAVGWTLIHEIFFYAAFAVTLLFSRRRLPICLAIWTALFLVGNFAGLADTPSFVRIFFHPLTAEFLMGAAMALLYLRRPDVSKRGVIFIIISALIISIAAASMIDLKPESGWSRVFIYGVPATLLTLSMALLEQSGVKFSSMMTALGDWSYALYLTHVLTLSLIGRIWVGFANPNSYLDNILMLMLAVLASIFISYLAYTIFEKPMRRLGYRLRGKAK